MFLDVREAFEGGRAGQAEGSGAEMGDKLEATGLSDWGGLGPDT